MSVDALAEKNHNLSPYNFADANPVFFNDPSGLDSGMPGWLQDLWDASPGNAETTWTNDGNGNFAVTNIKYATITAGPSSGGSSSSGSSAGGGGIAGFGIGSTYNINTGILTTAAGRMYSNYNSGSNNWNTRTGGDWQFVDLPGIIVRGKLGNINYRDEAGKIVAQINGITGNDSGGLAFPFYDAVGLGVEFGNVMLNLNAYLYTGTILDNIRDLGNNQYHYRGQNYWVGNYRQAPLSLFRQRNLANGLKFAKTLSKGLAVTGVAFTLAEFVSSDKSGGDIAKLVGATIITGTAFIPVVGPFISIGLGIADSFGAFDGIYNSFD